MEEKIIKITDKVVSIPPYLSTSWNAVAHIRTIGDRLVFTMKDGESVSIPGFSDALIKQVFESHIHYLEGDLFKAPKKENMVNLKLFGNPAFPEGLLPPPDLLRMSMQAPDMINMMQHNGEQKNMPELPLDMIDKISRVLKVVAPSDPDQFPKPEPHCNCPYCQIARHLHDMKRETVEVAQVEELVTEQDLAFSQYQIEPSGDKLFQVTDKLFPAEKFTVFLGEPIGCTCGKTGCEHVIAVLKS